MNRTEHVNAVKEREAKAWENAFKVFVEGSSIHSDKEIEKAIKIMDAIDSKLSSVITVNDEEVECAHCGFVCDCAFYEAGGEYPDSYNVFEGECANE